MPLDTADMGQIVLGTFLGFVFLLSSSIAQSDASSPPSIEGVWIEVVSGCDLHLPEDQVKNLAQSGGNSHYFSTILRLQNGTYSSEFFAGVGCKEEYSQFQRIDGDDNQYYCGSPVKSEGLYKPFGNAGIYSFEGSRTTMDRGAYEALGVDQKTVVVRMIGTTMIFEQRGTQQCLSGKTLVRYWIPYPMS
ncbi:MAG: hypothetical protein K2Q26_05530 [Bdellovibrionales bacterium]|nr:hypothetical protein [Bdellovibrionales bacterium]